jgi:hypothetical protein
MSAAHFSRGVPIQRRMNTGVVVIVQEAVEFSFEVLRIPKEDAIRVFPPNGSNQSLHEGM